MKNILHKYGYSSPTDGRYSIDGVFYTTNEDYRNIKRYKEYKDVGLDTLLLQANDPYSGEDWNTSQTKKNMDNAYASGIKRIIVCDKRIHELSETKGGIIGEDKPFKDEHSLVDYLSNCLKNYISHPGFIGVMLMDEPSYEYFLTIGQIEKALLNIKKDIYIQCNLLPYYACKEQLTDKENLSHYDSYYDYVEKFCLLTPHKILTMDSYPIRDENDELFIIKTHFVGLQIFSELAKIYNREKAFVIQSTAMTVKNKSKFRKLNYSTLLYQYNAVIAFGVNEISYFTYWAKQVNKTTWEAFPDNTSFISRDGHRTNVYNAIKKIHKSNIYKEQIISNYNYCSSLIINSDLKGDMKNSDDIGLDVISDAQLLITKLDNDDENLFIIMNIADPDINKDIANIKVINNSKVKIYKNRFPYIKKGNIDIKLFPSEIVMIRRKK